MTVSIIAAVGKNLELGKNNDLIWHFREDMKFFRETTTGHTVIMGRKTFESLPKALPNRQNIVITTDRSYAAEGALVVSSAEEALEQAQSDEVFIIGGGRVYGEFLGRADRLYLTEIDDSCGDADTFFPEFDKTLYNKKVLFRHIVDGTAFSHILYTKEESTVDRFYN